MFTEGICFAGLKLAAMYARIGMLPQEFVDDLIPLSEEGRDLNREKGSPEQWNALGIKINAVCEKHDYPPLLEPIEGNDEEVAA